MKEITKWTKIIYWYEKQEKKCAYCKRDIMFPNTETPEGFDILNVNIDHIIPTSRGGKDNLENTCLTCTECNMLKANMTSEEFLPALEKLKSGIINKKDLAEYAKYLVLKTKFGD